MNANIRERRRGEKSREADKKYSRSFVAEILYCLNLG